MLKIINYLKEIKRVYLYIIICCLVVIIGIISFLLVNQKPIIKKVTVKAKENVKEANEIKETVKVDIKGAVNNPGVYELDKNSRVIDALNVAGGMIDTADTSSINLSKTLTDEMTIIIYTKKQIEEYKEKNKKIEYVYIEVPTCPDNVNDACIESKKTNSTNSENGLVSINTATKEQLMTVSGIGESKANDIINYREQNGLFKSIEDIQNVKGIGSSLFEKIKNSITI